IRWRQSGTLFAISIRRIGANTVAIYAVLRSFIFGKTQVLTHGKGVVKFVVEAITHHLLITRIGVVLRTFVEVSPQTLTIWQRLDGSLFRQPAVITGFRLVLEVRKEGEISFIIRA